MKITLHALFALLTIVLSASAGPTLLLETTITRDHAKGGKDVLTAPRIAVENGNQAMVRVGKLEYAVTPTLLDDGTVELRAVITEHHGNKAYKLATPHIKSKLNQVAEIQVGAVGIATKASLAK
jgi:hypothetical protein